MRSRGTPLTARAPRLVPSRAMRLDRSALALVATLAAVVLAGCDGMLPAGTPRPGAIRVHGVPGQGELYLDGTSRGPIAATQELGGLRAGTHVLELRQAAPGGALVVASVPVEVREGLIADVRLDAPSVATPPPSLGSAAVRAPARYRVAAEPVTAEVYVDGIDVGRTPLEIELTPGAHRIELRAEGYQPLVQEVDASDGQPRSLTITLAPEARGGAPIAPEEETTPSAAGGTPRIRAGDSDVRGSLSRGVIRNVIRRHLGEVRFCYERELARAPTLEGRITVSFVISASGAVQSAAISTTTMNEPRVEECVVEAVRRWVFPAPDGGGVVGVNYPFVFDTGG